MDCEVERSTDGNLHYGECFLTGLVCTLYFTHFLNLFYIIIFHFYWLHINLAFICYPLTFHRRRSRISLKFFCQIMSCDIIYKINTRLKIWGNLSCHRGFHTVSYFFSLFFLSVFVGFKFDSTHSHYIAERDFLQNLSSR